MFPEKHTERHETMYFEDSLDNLLFMFAIFFILLLVILATARFCKFKRELDYINGEIWRTDGGEQKYWKAEKRRLILAFIFFLPIQ